MTRRRRIPLSLPGLLLGLAVVLSDGSAAQETITTPEIAASAISLSCLRFAIVGICVWLDCGPFGCDIETSVKVGHFNPDAVVSSTNGTGKNPWVELQALLRPVETAGAAAVLAPFGATPLLSGTGGITGGTAGQADPGPGGTRRTSNLNFRETDAIGHPVAGALYCPSAARPFVPYFVSELDAIGWRWQIPEALDPRSLIPGRREIGRWPIHTWGPVYPRSGFITQPDGPKAAAVTVQRAGDIVTRRRQVHVYNRLPSNGVFYSEGKRVWRPEPLQEDTNVGGDWQMLVPQIAGSCEVFGRNDTRSLGGWSAGKLSSSGDYAWTLWRPYTCCEERGIFLFSIDFLPYP